MLVPLNVVYPAFLQPYVVGVALLPLGIAAFTSEVFTLRQFNPSAALGRLTLAVIGANLVSSLLGVLLALQLPDQLTWVKSPTGGRFPEPGPHFFLYSVLSFPLLCALSILVEFFVLRFLRTWAGLSDLLPAVAVANVVSYSVLAMGALVF